MFKMLARRSMVASGMRGLATLAPAFRPSKPSVHTIKASPEEVRQGRLTEQHLELAVRHTLEDGLVVVENAIDHAVLDYLNEKMIEDAIVLRSRGKDSPFNYNQGNLQQDAPPVRKFFNPSIFLST